MGEGWGHQANRGVPTSRFLYPPAERTGKCMITHMETHTQTRGNNVQNTCKWHAKHMQTTCKTHAKEANEEELGSTGTDSVLDTGSPRPQNTSPQGHKRLLHLQSRELIERERMHLHGQEETEEQ